MINRLLSCVGLLAILSISIAARAADLTRLDLSALDGSTEVSVKQQGEVLRAEWPLVEGKTCFLELNLRRDLPLIRGTGIAHGPHMEPILRDVDPALVVTVGTRDLREGWVIFFDKVNTRPYESFPVTIARESARVVNVGERVSIIIDGASAGPFKGEYRFTIYPGSPLIHSEAVMSTDRPATAFLFDSGLVTRSESSFKHVVYESNDRHDTTVPADAMARPAIRVPVRHRLIGAEGSRGGFAFIVPHPHQYFYPLDFCDNFSTAWVGANFREHLNGTGFGVCQPLDGDRRYVPWVNAPPGTQQQMAVFYLLDSGDREDAFKSALAYTRGDRFEPLDGYKTFTSHYHVEMTIERLRDIERHKKQGEPDRHPRPEFVDVLRDMGVNIAHLAEFHLGDGDLKIAPRIDRLKLMHEECARWSDERLLLLPGEEPNVHLGGHWISFFPKPVYWTLDRTKDQPFVEEDPKLGTIYHVGNADDVLKLMEAENGLMWTAHPRIKGSLGFPDVYKSSPYFQSPHFLGGAWKAMPADYSIPKLGTRVLDLLDDMSNWGAKKQILGEVDVFAIDRHSELYAHMNVNYLKLDALPRFDSGWQGVLDALRGGKYFTTTGEVLIPAFGVDGRVSGDVLPIPSGMSTITATLEWTFPLDYAEIIVGDGSTIERHRIDVRDTRAFGKREMSASIDLRKKKWIRLEVWDVARSGAFTQPVLIGQ